MNKKYDIVIVGGGTSGVSCAWNAAKRGLKTLLIEKNSFLGGSITSTLVIPAMKTSEKSINNDFFDEFYSKLAEKNGALTYIDGNKGWFNPELAKIVLDELMLSVGVDILFETNVVEIKREKETLLVYIDTLDDNKNSCFTNEILSSPIETIYLVDATGDAKICEKLNCNFLKKNEKEFQPKSLRFILGGVDRERFSSWLMEYDTDRNVSTAAIIDGETHFSTAYTWDDNAKWALKSLFAKAIEKNILKEEDTNYFQMFSVAGTHDLVAFNCPRLLNNVQNPYIYGRSAIYRLHQFCKKYLIGFENSHITNIANTLGVRVSNRVEGEYVYTYEDLISGKTFDNPVVISNYPVDIHSDKKDASTLEKVYKEYQLPLEALKVRGQNNLFVIGRCISADFKAQGALRIIPSCFSMAEGLAKYLAKIAK